MAKKGGLSGITNKIGKAGLATSEVTGQRLKDLAASAVKTVEPKRIISKSVSAVRSQLSSETPEIGGFVSSIESFANDISKKISKMDKAIKASKFKDSEKDIKVIKQETEQHTDIFKNVTNLLASLDTSFNSQTFFMELLVKQGDAIQADLASLLDITANVWDVSQNQLDITRGQHELMIKESREADFSAQLANSRKEKEDNQKHLPQEKKKEETWWKHFLEVTLLGRLLQPILKAVAPILSFFGAKKVAGMLAGGVGTGTALGAGAAGGSLLGKMGKGLFGMAKKASIFALIADSIYGAGNRALKAFNEGEDGATIISEAIRGAIFTPLQDTFDLIGSILGIEMPNFEQAFDDLVQLFKNIYNNLPLIGEVLWNTTKDGVAKVSGILSDGWNIATDKIGEAIFHSYKWIEDKIVYIKDGFISYIEKSGERLMMGVTSITDGIQKTMDDIKTGFTEWLTKLKDIFVGGIKSIYTSVTETFPNWVGTQYENAVESVTGFTKFNPNESQINMDKAKEMLTPEQLQKIEKENLLGPRMLNLLKSQEDFLKSPLNTGQYANAAPSSIMTNNGNTSQTITNIISENLITRNPNGLVRSDMGYFQY